MKNNKKGFTLVELVIVVAVMAILVAVAIPAVSTITQTAEEQVEASNCRTIESMMKLAEAEAEAEDGGVDYAQKLYDSKLGIEEGTYYYDTVTGKVGTDEIDAGYVITFTDPAEAEEDAATPGVTVEEITE